MLRIGEAVTCPHRVRGHFRPGMPGLKPRRKPDFLASGGPRMGASTTATGLTQKVVSFVGAADCGPPDQIHQRAPSASPAMFDRDLLSIRMCSQSSQTRQAIDDYLKATQKTPDDYLFIGRRGKDRCLTARQYARLVSEWIASVGLARHCSAHTRCGEPSRR